MKPVAVWKVPGSAVIGAVLSAFMALSAAGEADAPPPVAAVGLVAFSSGGGCTGTLVAPDLVLTAAHCLSGKSVADDGIAFRTGAYPGHPAADFAVRDAVTHPFFLAARRAGTTAIGYDVAMLRLQTAVPASVARPLPVAEMPEDADAPVVAAFRGKATVRARERRCPVLERTERALVLSCAVRKGESGAPMLVNGGEGLSVIGVVSAQSRIGRTEVAVGAIAGPLVGALRALIEVSPSP